jgi:hypothetical protein
MAADEQYSHLIVDDPVTLTRVEARHCCRASTLAKMLVMVIHKLVYCYKQVNENATNQLLFNTQLRHVIVGLCK